MIIADNDNQDIHKWMCEKLGFEVAHTITVGVLEDGKLIAGISYFKKELVCSITAVASKGSWCKPETLSELLRIPFEMLNCKVAKFETSVYNKVANRFCKGIGCVKEGILRYAHHDGTHEIVWSLTKKEICKKGWYRHGKSKSS